MIDAHLQAATESIQRVKKNIQRLIFIAPEVLDYILATFAAGGHILLADTHGVGKTSLARALAGSISWGTGEALLEGQVKFKDFARVQGTVDLLPQDIVGFNRYQAATQSFVFQPGPIFSNVLLCDEINLLTPKTQGGFLQAMEEGVVTVDGVTYQIPAPFLLIATMNVRGEHLFRLPLPQLDRFAIRVSLGFPSEKDEHSIIRMHGDASAWDQFSAVAEVGEVLAWQHLIPKVEIHDKVIDYIVRFIRQSRSVLASGSASVSASNAGVAANSSSSNSRVTSGADDNYHLLSSSVVSGGLSSRAGIKISQLARALALVRGEKFATIDHVKELAVPVLAHRLAQVEAGQESAARIREIETRVAV